MSRTEGDHLFKAGNELWKFRIKCGPAPKFTEEELIHNIEEYVKDVMQNPIPVEKIIAAPSEVVTTHEDGSVTTEKLPYTRITTYKQRPLLTSGLAAFLGISEQAVRNYRKKNEEYAKILKEADALFRGQKIDGTSVGIFNPLIIMSELGMRNHKDVKKTVHKSDMTPEEEDKRIADLMAKAAKQGNQASEDDDGFDAD